MKNRTDRITVRRTTWQADQARLQAIRTHVFIEEQHVPVELEWDEHDAHSTHLLAFDNQGNPIGTARMLINGHIGRMAVLKPWRGQGVGSALLETLIDIAHQNGLEQVVLHAQTTAIGFYQRHGFHISSDEFMDAGIPHRSMTLKLHAT